MSMIHALLSAVDDAGTTVAKHRVPVNFKFNRDVANEWVRGGSGSPLALNLLERRYQTFSPPGERRNVWATSSKTAANVGSSGRRASRSKASSG